MHLPHNFLWRWLLVTVISVPLCLAVWWWYLRDPLIAILAWAVGSAAPLIWPDTVLDVRIYEGKAWLISLVPTLTDPPRLFTTLPLRLNRAVAIFPLFWGLTLATPGRHLLKRLLLGTAVLLPVAFIMALLTTQFVFALYRTHIPMLTVMPPNYFGLVLPDTPIAFYLWGLGRQLSVLVLPIVAPLLVWLGLHSSFLSQVIREGLSKPNIHSINPTSKPPGGMST